MIGAVVGVRSVATTPQVRAAATDAGAAPIDRGEPGYRAGMDGDDDGIACEPYRA